ncbi:MAG: metal-dependent transcriptional regulator [Clostridia bacterium]
MKIQESGENYLETILILQKTRPVVHAVDVALELDFAKASVSRGLGILQEAKLINVDNSGGITFTERGLVRAEEVYARHKVLTAFLANLGIDRTIAEEDACRIEHVISVETFETIKKIVEKKK